LALTARRAGAFFCQERARRGLAVLLGNMTWPPTRLGAAKLVDDPFSAPLLSRPQVEGLNPRVFGP